MRLHVIYKHVSGTTLDAAYKYLNWWLSGLPGANMARQAYYSPRPDTTKKFLSKAEWDYWYGGKPAAHEPGRTGRQAGDPEGRGPRGRLVHPADPSVRCVEHDPAAERLHGDPVE